MTSEYSLKVEPEDFLVVEVPLMPEFSARQGAAYTHAWMKKRLVSTFDAIGELSRATGIAERDIACEGLKDEDGVTQQIVSLKGALSEADVERVNAACGADPKRYVRIERIIGYGMAPVKEKRLLGNAFEIAVRGLTEARARSVKALCDAERRVSMVNYYDGQRFGLPGGPYNSHLIGKAIVAGDLAEAAKQYELSGNPPLRDGAKGLSALDPRKLSFFVSSYNSYLWNEAARREVAASCETVSCVIDGGSEICFPRSGSCPALPLRLSAPGYELSLGAPVPKDNPRALAVATDVFASDPALDELEAGSWKVKLSFFLPTGSYATMLVRQIVSSSRSYDERA